MVTSHKIVTHLKQKLKTLAIWAVSIYPPVLYLHMICIKMGNGITTYFGSYGIVHRTESHGDLSE